MLSVWRPEPIRRMGLGKRRVRAAQFVSFMNHKADFICIKALFDRKLQFVKMEQQESLWYLQDVS